MLVGEIGRGSLMLGLIMMDLLWWCNHSRLQVWKGKEVDSKLADSFGTEDREAEIHGLERA